MLQAKQDAVKATAERLMKANNTVTCLEIKVDLWNNSKEYINGVPYSELYWDEKLISDCMDQNCAAWGLAWATDNNPVPHRVYSFVSQPVNQPVVTQVKRGRGRPAGAKNKPKATITPAPVAFTPLNLPTQTAAQVASVATPKRGRGRPAGAKNKTKTVVAVSSPVLATAAPVVTSKPTFISRKAALQLMETAGGQYFTATFIKKDNTERTMNCQFLKDQSDSKLGYVKVKVAGIMKKSKNANTALNPIRQVNLQTLKSLKIKGNIYKIR